MCGYVTKVFVKACQSATLLLQLLHAGLLPPRATTPVAEEHCGAI